ncbi:hypothetical protein ACFQMM_02310 [Saliphagus sp. GCM10025308]
MVSSDDSNGDRDPRGPKDVHRLTDYEREFALEGSSTSKYHPGTLRRNIHTKAGLLPTRIEALYTDINILAKGDYLREEFGLDYWKKLLENVETVDFTDEPTGTSIEQQRAARVALGRRIGTMLKHLVPSELTADDEVYHDVLWGITDAFYLRGPSGSSLYGGRANRMDDLIERLEYQNQQAIHEDHQAEQGIEATMKSLDWDITPQTLRVRIERMVEADELQEWTHDPLADHLQADSSVDPAVIMERAGWYLVDSVVDSGTPGSFGQWRAFIRECNAGLDFDAYVTKERVIEVIKEHRLVEREQLRQLLDHDGTRLENQRWHDAHAVEVVRAVFEHDGALSSRKAADKIGVPDDSSAVTALARDLAGARDREFGDVWEDRPSSRAIEMDGS